MGGNRVTTIRGTFQNGVIVLDGPAPAAWAEGHEFVVLPKSEWQSDHDNEHRTPEEIEEMIREWDSIPIPEKAAADTDRFQEWLKASRTMEREAMANELLSESLGDTERSAIEIEESIRELESIPPMVFDADELQRLDQFLNNRKRDDLQLESRPHRIEEVIRR